MNRTFILCFVCFISFGLSSLAKTHWHINQSEDTTGVLSKEAQTLQPKHYRRIVSLAPSITEILYALGLGEQIVGVTDFCFFPPEAKSKPRVGGLFNPNYEMISSLKPDLIIHFPEQIEISNKLSLLNLPLMEIRHLTIHDIITSIETIGVVCDAKDLASSLVSDINVRMNNISRRIGAENTRPSVLISVGRDLGDGDLKEVYIAGNDGFYNELISLSGGKNVYKGEVSFPAISAEGLTILDPDIIIDLIPDLETKGWSVEIALREWKSLSHLRAVKDNRVYVLSEDFMVVPGPRFVRSLEILTDIIHPLRAESKM